MSVVSHLDRTPGKDEYRLLVIKEPGDGRTLYLNKDGNWVVRDEPWWVPFEDHEYAMIIPGNLMSYMNKAVGRTLPELADA